MAQPFLFLSDTAAVSNLRARLEELGLEVVQIQESETAYNPASVVLRCASIQDQPLRIEWQRKWWPDGLHQEDETVSLFAGGEVLFTMDIAALLRTKLAAPLPEVITNGLVEVASRLTRKSS